MSNEIRQDEPQHEVLHDGESVAKPVNQLVSAESVPVELAPVEETQVEIVTSAAPESVQTPGAQLAARREALGLTPERIAEQLKMTARQILAIEADNHASVHSKAIFRGFVRAYAKVLKMNPDVLVAMIPDDAPIPINRSATQRRITEPFSETRLPFIGRRNTQSRKIVIAIGALVLFIGVLLGQKMGWIPALPKSITQRFNTAPTVNASVSDASFAKSASASTVIDKLDSANAAAPTQLDANEKIKKIELSPVDVSAQLASAPPTQAVPTSATNASTSDAATSNSATPASPNASDNALVITSREESWIEIRRADGKLIVDHKIPAGTSETFKITEPVQVTLGNGPGVKATLRGAALNIPADPNSKVVRLNLK